MEGVALCFVVLVLPLVGFLWAQQERTGKV